jgi:hypothetical protein
MNERLACDDVRKLTLLTRKTIQRHKRLLSETDQLLRASDQLMRDSRDLVSRSQELIRQGQPLKRPASEPVGRGRQKLISHWLSERRRFVRPWGDR